MKKKKYWKYADVFLLFKDNTTVDHFRSVNLISFHFSPPGKQTMTWLHWRICLSNDFPYDHRNISTRKRKSKQWFRPPYSNEKKENNEERNTVAIHDGRLLLTGALNQEIIWFTTTENVLMPWAKQKSFQFIPNQERKYMISLNCEILRKLISLLTWDYPEKGHFFPTHISHVYFSL